MESKRRKVVSCAEEDRITNLPEQLIDSILERVPFEDAVRTSIISKKWRYRWTKMKALVFDEHFSKKYAINGAFGRNGLIMIIYKVLILHSGPILKFHLHLPNMDLDSFQEVDQFILLLSRNGVTELILTNLNQRYELPSYVFSCLELTKLRLENCLFKPPLEFEGFPNLEELFLDEIDFGANVRGTELYLPQLKDLSMYECTNVHNFKIKATKLHSLSVMDCPDALLLRLSDSPHLILLSISFLQPIEDFEIMNLARILSDLARIKNFSIFSVDGHFLKFFIAEKIPKLLPHPIKSLKKLALSDFQLGDMDQLYGALCLLRNSPNLEKLQMFMEEVSPVDNDMGPTLNQLETPDCLDCTLNQLQTVEITDLEGSRSELLFIELLLAHSPSLEKFTIRPSGGIDFQKKLDILKDVTQFPRASPKAKIFYLDTEP